MKNRRLFPLLAAMASCVLALSSCSPSSPADHAESQSATISAQSTRQDASQSQSASSASQGRTDATTDLHQSAVSTQQDARASSSESDSAIAPAVRSLAIRGCTDTGQNEAYCACVIDELASRYDTAGFLDLSTRLAQHDNEAIQEIFQTGMSCSHLLDFTSPSPTGSGTESSAGSESADPSVTPDGYVKPDGSDWPDAQIDTFIRSCTMAGGSREECHCAVSVTMGRVPFAEAADVFSDSARTEQIQREVTELCRQAQP